MENVLSDPIETDRLATVVAVGDGWFDYQLESEQPDGTVRRFKAAPFNEKECRWVLSFQMGNSFPIRIAEGDPLTDKLLR